MYKSFPISHRLMNNGVSKQRSSVQNKTTVSSREKIVIPYKFKEVKDTTKINRLCDHSRSVIDIDNTGKKSVNSRSLSVDKATGKSSSCSDISVPPNPTVNGWGLGELSSPRADTFEINEFLNHQNGPSINGEQVHKFSFFFIKFFELGTEYFGAKPILYFILITTALAITFLLFKYCSKSKEMTNSSIFKIVNINMFIFALINVILIPGIMFSNHSTLNESLFLNSKVLMISFFIINMNLISCTVVECIMNIRSFNKEFFFLILNVTSLNLAIFTFLVLRSFDFICLSILTFILVMLLHLRSIVRLEAFERKSVSSLPN